MILAVILALLVPHKWGSPCLRPCQKLRRRTPEGGDLSYLSWAWLQNSHCIFLRLCSGCPEPSSLCSAVPRVFWAGRRIAVCTAEHPGRGSWEPPVEQGSTPWLWTAWFCCHECRQELRHLKRQQAAHVCRGLGCAPKATRGSRLREGKCAWAGVPVLQGAEVIQPCLGFLSVCWCSWGMERDVKSSFDICLGLQRPSQASSAVCLPPFQQRSEVDHLCPKALLETCEFKDLCAHIDVLVSTFFLSYCLYILHTYICSFVVYCISD